MASKEESLNLWANWEVLRSFSLSDSETSVEQNLHHAHTHHHSLMCQWMAVEDAQEMAWIFDAKRNSMEQIKEEEQTHRMQVATLSQMQLQTMERMETQEQVKKEMTALEKNWNWLHQHLSGCQNIKWLLRH